MNVTAVVITALILGAVCFVAERWRKPWAQLQERKVQIEERRTREPDVSQLEPMPPILNHLARGESEDWAVADAMKAYEEMHRKTSNWGIVAQKAEESGKGEKWEIVN